MSAERTSRDEIRIRIEPTLKNVAVKGLKAWLRSLELPATASTRETISIAVADQIANGSLTEDALGAALIGFEEASDMRIYLFRLDESPTGKASNWLPTSLAQASIQIKDRPTFAGERNKPMSPVYATLSGNLLRVKWTEMQINAKLDPSGRKIVNNDVQRIVVLLADFNAGTAELRLNPPENNHSYEDAQGRPSSELYYQAYIDKASTILRSTLLPLDIRRVIQALIEEETPRVVRIHIDNHTNQKNGKMKMNCSRGDVRDDPDWMHAYQQNGSTWAYDSLHFYWLPKVSSGFLKRELYSQLDAESSYLKVNADCSDEEVNYVVSQIRAR